MFEVLANVKKKIVSSFLHTSIVLWSMLLLKKKEKEKTAKGINRYN